MDISKISSGKDVPNDVNVVIEIPQGSQVKYEVDKESGAIFVDRFLFTPMAYPTAYGFIPNTLAADGDPVDALVLAPAAVVPGCVIRARPIGVLKMEDESGRDEKIICVPHDKIHPQFHDVNNIEDLPEITRKAIAHFFERYKDLEPNKWVKVSGWDSKEEAGKIIIEALNAAKK
ncbi:inorganic diphosphatase [Aristophania vespae]|uniref:Inorganic pyrophosphatase n=1 Tax=Aristophania vespae TaxID=2697033 RepID=A0A6P1NBV0_9PROT|nr:inorganic diphosphatase [Aristophania vespae]QHI94993.1 inorganic diphosphatase [Aristophania vespae]UMM64163.1 Inorganic pyrophosphatase [Aristophania vespae]